MRFLQEQTQRGQLDFIVGNSTIIVPLARSINTIVEPEPEPDPIEEVLMVSQEEIVQPFFDEEHFIREGEELAEPIELDVNEQPPPPSIELKPLPPGLRYVFLHNNRNTPVIISDKLSEYETQQLLTVLQRHRSAIGYSLYDLKGISATLCTHRIPTDPNNSASREHQRMLNKLYRRLVRKRSLSFCTLGLFIPFHIVVG